MENDSDGDGWDDRWTAAYPEIDRTDPLADPNGDGLPLYLEMAMGLDPTLDRRGAKAPDPGEEMRQLRKRIETVRANYERTRAYVQTGHRDATGRPLTAEQHLATRRAKAAANTERLRLEQAAQEKKIDAWLRANPKAERADGRRPYRIDASGQALWRSALTSSQAWQSAAAELWPGELPNAQALQIDATGAGTTISLWDDSGVRETHQQLISVTIDDVDSIGTSDHATAVACILCGQGDPSETMPGANPRTSTLPEAARGISYGAALRTRNSVGDLVGMSADSQDPTIFDLRLGVHPYATDCGWEKSPPGATVEWTWYGNPIVSQVEDWKFGAYMDRTREIDQICYDDPDSVMLPVWAAGNDAANITDTALLGSPPPYDEVPEQDGHWHNGQFNVPIEHLLEDGTVVTDKVRPEDGVDAFHSGFSDTIRPEGCAKNVLTVNSPGGAGLFSRGPTDDGRIKPDLFAVGGGIDFELPQPANITTAFAPGNGSYGPIMGTSFAAPVVAGGMALVLDLWQQRRGTSPHAAPWGSTLKALAIAGADTLTSFEANPNLNEGWGEFDAHNSALIVHRDTEDGPVPAAALAPETVRAMHRNIKQLELPAEPGSTISFFVERDSDESSFWTANGLTFGDRPAVTICWTDPEATTVQEALTGGPSPLDVRDRRLVNDLDLRVIEDDGTELMPYATVWDNFDNEWKIVNGDNVRDNVERIEINDFQGVYEVRITHKGTTQNGNTVGPLAGGVPQKVSVVITGASVFDPPVLGNLTICQTTVAGGMCLEWDATLGSVVAVETSTDLENWSEITQIRASSTHVSYDVAPSTDPDRYYRIRRLD